MSKETKRLEEIITRTKNDNAKLREVLELSIRALKIVKRNFDKNQDLHFVDEIVIDTALKAYDDIN